MPVPYLRTKAMCPYKGRRQKEVLQHECVCFDCAEFEPGCMIRPAIISTHNGVPMRDILRQREERPKSRANPLANKQCFVDDIQGRQVSWAQRFADGQEMLNGTYR